MRSPIPNTLEGFNLPLSKIHACTKSQDKIKAGLEATGHYSCNLLGFLLNNGLATYVLNPLPKEPHPAKGKDWSCGRS